MPTILECPHCESRFQIDVVAPRVDCPKCQINFKPIAALPTTVPASNAGQSKSGIKAPRRLQTESRVSPPTQRPDSRPASPPPLVASPGNSSTAPQVANSKPKPVGISVAAKPPTRSRRRNKKNNLWLTLLTVILAAIAIGGLYAIVTTLGKADPETSNNEDGQSSTALASDSNKSGTDGEDANSKGGFDEAAKRFAKGNTRSKPIEPPVPPVDETPEFFSPRDGDVVWSKIGSYLVKLEIETPVSSRVQTGIIVDSRGWVLTSLKGLKDAGKVTVTVAAKNLDDRPPFRELSDQAHGIIATHPQLDLAVIAINRIQVNNLTEIPFFQSDEVFRSQKFWIARTPPPGHQRWLAECRIEKRGKTSELDPKIQKAILDCALDPEVRFIQYPPRIKSNLTSHIAGSPLIDLKGNVMAINTGMTASGNVVAIPGPAAQQFLKSIPNPAPQAKPFARQVDLVQTTETSEGPDGTVSPVVETPEMQYDSILRQLDSAIETARSTDWTAESDVEYLAMKKVPELILQAEQWIATNFKRQDEAESERERLEALIDEIGESLEVDLDIEEFQSGKGNEFFASQVSEQSPWFMVFVRVKKDLFNSPPLDGSDTAVLKLLGTDKKLVATLSDDVRSFRNNRWLLLLGRLDARGTVNRDGAEMQIIEVLSAYELSTR